MPLQLVCLLMARQTPSPTLSRIDIYVNQVCAPGNLHSSRGPRPLQPARDRLSHLVSRPADHQNPYSTLTVLRPSQHIGNAPAFKAHVFDHGAVAGALPIMPNDITGRTLAQAFGNAILRSLLKDDVSSKCVRSAGCQ